MMKHLSGDDSKTEEEEDKAGIRKAVVDTEYAIGPIRAFFLRIVRKLRSFVKTGGVFDKILSGTESGLLIGTKKRVLTAGKSNSDMKQPAEDKTNDAKKGELGDLEKVESSEVEKTINNMSWVYETLKKGGKESELLQEIASHSLNSLKVDGKDTIEKNGEDKAEKAGVPKVRKGKRYVDWVLFDTSNNLMKMAQKKGIELTSNDGSDRDIASVYADWKKAVKKELAYKSFMDDYAKKMEASKTAKGNKNNRDNRDNRGEAEK